jgi:hypothetical protein
VTNDDKYRTVSVQVSNRARVHAEVGRNHPSKGADQYRPGVDSRWYRTCGSWPRCPDNWRHACRIPAIVVLVYRILTLLVLALLGWAVFLGIAIRREHRQMATPTAPRSCTR